MKVSQEKVDALMEDMHENIPDLQIIYKDEPLPKWWMKVLFFLVSVVGFFNSSFEDKWMKRISNGIGGKWIMLPSKNSHGDFTEYNVYTVIRHEYAHLLDQKKYPFVFGLTYALFPLPSGLAGRAHWEFRGYAQNLIVQWEEFGRINDQTVEWIASQFWGSLYFWMWPFKKYVRKKLKGLVEDIKAGKVEGYNPDIKWW